MATAEPATVAVAEQKAKRVRALLSSYYGTSGMPTGQQGAGPSLYDKSPQSAASAINFGQSTAPVKVAGLDSAAFEQEKYLAHLLRQTRLDALLMKHIEMSTEIKSLDSDMQMLVYENYNKFISATDTIRSMKSNMESMDTNMHDLQQTIDSVSGLSNTVNSKLQLRRDEIEELNQVRALLFKLQAVFDLPRRLRAAMDRGAYDIAADSYADAAPLLKRYGHKGAFRQVAAEADASAKKLTALLKRRMASAPGEAAECIQLVRKLGEPIESLQEDFLACMRHRLDAVLKEATIVADAMAAAQHLTPPLAEAALKAVADPEAWGFDTAFAPPPLDAFVVQLDQRFLSELGHTAALFGDLFEPAGRRSLVKLCREEFGAYLQIIKRVLADTAATESARAAGLNVACREAEADGSPVSETPKGHQRARFAADWGAERLAGALYTISNDVPRIQSLLPELSPKDRAAEVVEAGVRHHVGLCFAALEQRVMGALIETQAQLATEQEVSEGGLPSQVLSRGLASVSSTVLNGTEALVGALKVYQHKEWVLRSWQDVFVDLVQGQLQHLFLSLLRQFLALAGVRLQGADLAAAQSPPTLPLGSGSAPSTPTHAPAASPSTPPRGASSPTASAAPLPPPGLVLLLSRACAFMEGSAVPAVMELLAATFPGQGGGSGEDQPPAFVAGEVARRLGVGAHLLLAGYIEAHGLVLTQAVQRSTAGADWLAGAEQPTAPRPVCGLLLQRLAVAEKEVVQLIDDGGQRAGGGVRAGSVGGAGGGSADQWDLPPAAMGGNALEHTVSRLFRERVKYFTRVEFTQASVLAGIVRVGLKALVECVRLETLGRAGLQQLQLDVHYLRPLLRRFAQGGESVTLYHLLDEVLTAAVERATDPTLLAGPAVERILSTVGAGPSR